MRSGDELLAAAARLAGSRGLGTSYTNCCWHSCGRPTDRLVSRHRRFFFHSCAGVAKTGPNPTDRASAQVPSTISSREAQGTRLR